MLQLLNVPDYKLDHFGNEMLNDLMSYTYQSKIIIDMYYNAFKINFTYMGLQWTIVNEYREFYLRGLLHRDIFIQLNTILVSDNHRLLMYKDLRMVIRQN